MISDLTQNFRDPLAAIPRDHPKHRVLELIEEAIRRDIRVIDRHPTTLFQCMWILCWWYDSSLHRLRTNTADTSRNMRYAWRLVEGN